MAIQCCSVDGCEKPILTRKADSRGLCRKHHFSLVSYGTVFGTEDGYGLWQHVDLLRHPDGCWQWTGGMTTHGYGRYCNQSSHRLVYEFCCGPLDGLEIDHTCHNRSCVNPSHLRPATSKQNKENRKGAHGRSGIRGVSKVGNRWRACVVHNRKYIHLGFYDTAEQAGEVARLKRLEMFSHNDVDRRAV